MDKVMHIGLDISITSTGMCISIDNCMKQFLFVDKDIDEKDKVQGVEYIKFNRIVKEDCASHDILTILSAENQAKEILKVIEHYCKLYKVEKPLQIYIEGASYMSKGKYALDIPVYQGIVKRKMLTITDKQFIRVLPPTTLKKAFTGNGRASKPEMEKAYIEKGCLPILKKRIKSIKSDDVVDATALVWVHTIGKQ